MRTTSIAFEITNTGAARPLDAYETACVLADLRRWDEEPADARQVPRFRRFAPDHCVVGGTLVVLVNLALGLCQIAGVI